MNANINIILVRRIADRWYVFPGNSDDRSYDDDIKRNGRDFDSCDAAFTYASEFAKSLEIPETEISELLVRKYD